MDSNEHGKLTATLEIIHERDGKVIGHIMPYETASFTDKILYWLRLKNLTR